MCAARTVIYGRRRKENKSLHPLTYLKGVCIINGLATATIPMLTVATLYKFQFLPWAGEVCTFA
jgi:hypothetical protein